MREPCSANCLAAGSCPRKSMTSGRLTCLCQGQGEASLCIIPNPLPLLSPEKISCFSLLTDRFLPSSVIGSRRVNPACGPEAVIAQVTREVLAGGDYLLCQGQQLGQPGDREETADPTGGSDGNGVPAACEEKQPWGQRRAVPVGRGLGGSCSPGRVRGAQGLGTAVQQPKHVGTRGSCSMLGTHVSVPQLCCCWDCAPLSPGFSSHGGC